MNRNIQQFVYRTVEVTIIDIKTFNVGADLTK